MRARYALTLIGLLAFTGSSAPAEAGCGCDKPPPPPAAIRPAVASPGDAVTLFDSALVPGAAYTVRFTSGTTTVSVPGVAVLRRDFADAVTKAQIVVPAPKLPLGPASVNVYAATGLLTGAPAVISVPATDFTALPPAIVLTEENARNVFYCYRAAVGADGTTYIPVNVGAIEQHMIFKGFGQAYPLAFNPSDVTIYNTQGVLMQLLNPQNAAIYAIADDQGSDNSFSLTYDRHEFVTYRQEHLHEGNRLLDPTDPMWHLDGTRHIDHDDLVIAIHSQLKGGGYPTPGATKSFNLDITTALDTGTFRTYRNVDMCQLR